MSYNEFVNQLHGNQIFSITLEKLYFFMLVFLSSISTCGYQDVLILLLLRPLLSRCVFFIYFYCLRFISDV